MTTRKMVREMLFAVVVTGLIFIAAGCETPGEKKAVAHIVVKTSADPLEQLAGQELSRYIKKLFNVDATISNKAVEADYLFHVGVVSDKDLSDQGVLLHPDGQSLVIGGGSPKAVLWAVYELVEKWGVRYLIHGDVFPADAGELWLPENEIRLEPNMKIRCWRLINEFPLGPVSWSLEENRQFLRQITKMKYNRIHLSLWPAQPFVDYSFRGMQKPDPKFFFGYSFPISDDAVGKEYFEGMTEFSNPEFRDIKSPKELIEPSIQLVHDILAQAKALGMETVLSIQPFDWPKEFMEVLPGSEPTRQLGSLTAGPGHNQSMDDPLLREMISTIFKAYVETYPEVDYIRIGMPEHRGWAGQAENAYELFSKQYDLTEVGSFEQLCKKALGRTNYPGGGERVETQLKGDLASLWFFYSLMQEKDLLRRSDGSTVKLIFNGVTGELFPLLGKIIPPGGEIVNFIEYTASRQLRFRELLRQKPPANVPTSLIFTLADDNVGVLPQMVTGSFHELLSELRANEWDGFFTRYWTVSDLDPTVHYLSRASWDASVTPAWAYRDLIANVCGEQSVEPASKAFELIEEITITLDQKALGIAFPIENMMTKHYGKTEMAAPIKNVHGKYRQALEAMRQAQKTCRPAGRDFIDYHVARLEFAIKYLDAVENFIAASKAEKDGKINDAADSAKQACQDIRQAIGAWAGVIRDHGDLGAIAMLNNYCYYPIRDKRDELIKAAENQKSK